MYARTGSGTKGTSVNPLTHLHGISGLSYT